MGTTSNPQKDLTTSRKTQKLIGRYRNIVFDDNFLKKMDPTTILETGPSMTEWTIQNKVNKVAKFFF